MARYNHAYCLGNQLKSGRPDMGSAADKLPSAQTPFGHQSSDLLDEAYSCRFQPFSALDDIDDDSLTLVEGREPGSFKGRDVDEHVLSTAIASNEAEALLDVESLHGADFLDRPGNRAARSACSKARPQWCRRLCGAAIDANHHGDVWAFITINCSACGAKRLTTTIRWSRAWRRRRALRAWPRRAADEFGRRGHNPCRQ